MGNCDSCSLLTTTCCHPSRKWKSPLSVRCARAAPMMAFCTWMLFCCLCFRGHDSSFFFFFFFCCFFLFFSFFLSFFLLFFFSFFLLLLLSSLFFIFLPLSLMLLSCCLPCAPSLVCLKRLLQQITTTSVKGDTTLESITGFVDREGRRKRAGTTVFQSRHEQYQQ